MLAQDADPATATELADAQEEIARLSRLVDGLLAVARAENVVTEPVVVAVADVLRDRVAAWAPVADERAVALALPDPGRSRPASVTGTWSRSWTTCSRTRWTRSRPVATSGSALSRANEASGSWWRTPALA